MARRTRVVFEGAIYHVMFRGNARQSIFLDNRDRERFLESLADRVVEYGVRLYLYCLMKTHAHLLVETPRANLPAFMGSLLTSYATYFNLKHERVGHLTQGRYKSPLVEGNMYLLRLSRYIHLNPVWSTRWKNEEPKERLMHLRSYPWSSYRAYAGLAKQEEYVDYNPVLEMMKDLGIGRGKVMTRYRHFVESGLAKTDDEFSELVRRSSLALGSEKFVAEMEKLYEEASRQRVNREDVAFRKQREAVAPAIILDHVYKYYGISEDELKSHRLNDKIKPVAAALLTRLGGLTQREAASYLGLSTGAAVCLQLKRLKAGQIPQQTKDLTQLEQEFNI